MGLIKEQKIKGVFNQAFADVKVFVFVVNNQAYANLLAYKVSNQTYADKNIYFANNQA